MLLLLMFVGLSGCGGNKSAFSGKGSPRYTGPDPIPRGGGAYKVGNPYKIAGKTYIPKEQPNYDETGIASWYGEAFHKRQTANGEWYDMNALTAAHPTLPIPSYVRVTNLKNNKSLVVRVNDRGPYSPGRIIDMSKRSAQVLGFQNDGITKVRVQWLSDAPLEYTDRDIAEMNRKHRTNSSSRLFSEAAPADNIQTGSITPPPGGFYVQAASFTNRENAQQLSRRLSALGRVDIDEREIGLNRIYRVRIGPMSDERQARSTLEQVRSAGQRDAHITTR